MKIVSNLNGNTKTTSYGNKLYYRGSTNEQFKQIKRAFYRESENSNYTQVYLFDETPPVVTITSSSATTINPSYALTATIVDTQSGVASVKVNGVEVGATTSLYLVYTLQEGLNTFTIVATDNAGNSSSASISIAYVVSDRNNVNRNWSDSRDKEYYSYGPYVWYAGREVYVNGSWVTFYEEGLAGNWTGVLPPPYSYVQATASIGIGILLPRGLSSCTFEASSDSDGITIGQVRVWITDDSTGQTVADSGTQIRGASVSYNFPSSNASHTFSVHVSGNAGKYEYETARCGVGISNWSFSWVQ